MGGPSRITAVLVLLTPLAGAAILSFDLRDTDGRRHTAAEALSGKAGVFLFLGTDCPISNRYAPDLARLVGDYSPRGVNFYGVHSDSFTAIEEVRRHAREFGYEFPVLMDSAQSLARQTGATTTPEAAVFSPARQLLYRGRIDDRASDLARQRPRASRHDLRLALDELLAGKRVSRPRTEAVGCSIPFTSTGAAGKGTFARDVAPILYQNCAGCHRPGESGPFPLLTYQDAARRASLIGRVTASRYMPPWKPEPGYGEFEGERGLTPLEIETIREWAANGAPEGDAAEAPPLPKFPQEWQLGPPDIVVKMPKRFPIPAGGPDIYQCFVVPLGLESDRYLRAIEFRPENRRLVHHALLFADRSGAARGKEADPGGGYPCFGAPGFLPAGGLGGWAPGSRPVTLPEGAAMPLRKGSDLVLQLHFHPTGKRESEQSEVGLYFTATPPKTRLVDIALGSRNIDIPPGEAAYTVRDGFTLPVDAVAVGVIPHAHYICKEMKGTALLPDGTKQSLIWIKDWDFNWQEQYRYQTPMRLPAGTRLEMEFIYDNSEQNPRNPNRPPRRVLWGPDSTDEMAGLHIQALPERASDLPELLNALWGKFMRSVGGGFFRPD